MSDTDVEVTQSAQADSNIPKRDGYYWIRIRGGKPEFQIALWIASKGVWTSFSGNTVEPTPGIEIISRVKEPNPDPGVYLIMIRNPSGKMFEGIDKPQVAQCIGHEDGYWKLAFKDAIFVEGRDCEWVEIIRPLVAEEELL